MGPLAHSPIDSAAPDIPQGSPVVSLPFVATAGRARQPNHGARHTQLIETRLLVQALMAAMSCGIAQTFLHKTPI